MTLAGAVALVVAHVVGTFLGTRLRDTSSEVVAWKARTNADGGDRPVALPQPVTFANVALPETTPLAERSHSPRRHQWSVAAGGIAGFALGYAALYHVAGPTATQAGLALGATSCSVIGAWLSLLACNFWTIARQAWRHADKADKEE